MYLELYNNIIYMLKIILLIILGFGLVLCTLEKQKCKVINNQTYCINEDSSTSRYEYLTLIDTNFEKIIKHLEINHPKNNVTKRLVKNYKNKTKMSELYDKKKHIAFSKNKGEEVSICLDDSNLDKNVMMFIAIHELSHIATEEVGHTDNFWSNMKFLLECAVKLNIYIPQDYSKFPVTFCGYEIDKSPLYN